MESTSSGSDTATAGGRGASNGYYHSKYGDVAILDGQNYTEFRQTCEMALTVADTIDMVLGTEPRPNSTAEGRKWDARANKAIQIIANSVTPGIRNKISTQLREKKLKEAWEQLAKYDRSDNTTYQLSIKNQFSKEKWNIQTETVWQFIERLESYRIQLKEGITDTEIQSRLLDSLPSDPFWETTRQHVYLQDLDHEKLITFLDTNHRHYKSTYTSTDTAQASANAVHSEESRQRRGRSNKRGSRSRSKDRNKHKSKKRSRRYSSSSSSSESTDKDLKCYWCKSRDHMEKDCKAYLEARKQFQERQNSESKGKKKEPRVEYASMVTHIPSYD